MDFELCVFKSIAAEKNETIPGWLCNLRAARAMRNSFPPIIRQTRRKVLEN